MISGFTRSGSQLTKGILFTINLAITPMEIKRDASACSHAVFDYENFSSVILTRDMRDFVSPPRPSVYESHDGNRLRLHRSDVGHEDDYPVRLNKSARPSFWLYAGFLILIHDGFRAFSSYGLSARFPTMPSRSN